MSRDVARRSLLAGISAVPAAMMAGPLPTAVQAHPARPVVEPDADLIAQAALARRLSRLYDRACDRCARKSDAVQLAMGRRPVGPGWSGMAADAAAAQQRHADAVAAYDAEEKRLMQAWGVQQADDLSQRLLHRLLDTAAILEGMPATTLAGLAAKASAVLAESCLDNSLWATTLASSLAADVVRMGGRRVT